MPVSDNHPDYQAALPQWEMSRDAVAGSTAIKTRQSMSENNQSGGNMAGVRYLPMPNPEDQSIENRQRYADYKLRANYVNVTGQTKEGMVGLVYRIDPTVILPPTIEYLNGSTDGGAITLNQLSKGALCDCLEVGRSGILTDYPMADIGLTQSEVSALELRANLLRYTAESIINWRTIKVGGVKKLSLVVLAEPTQKLSEDGFSYESVIYHRVLRLTNGIYSQSLYDEDDKVIETDSGETLIFPRKSNGALWNEIPFTFIGTEDNDEAVDKATLYDIAEVNIAHYRNSADYEESSYMVGQPTPYVTGLTQGWVDAVLDGKITLGSRAAILLPEGASAGLIQAQSNQMPIEGMKHKEQQMIQIGARIITDQSGNETATGAKIKFAGQNSKLGAIIGNVEEAIERSLGWALEFMGGVGDVTFELNRKFHDIEIDPQEIIADIQLLDRGVIAMEDMRNRLRKFNIIEQDRDDEMIEAEAEANDPI